MKPFPQKSAIQILVILYGLAEETSTLWQFVQFVAKRFLRTNGNWNYLELASKRSATLLQFTTFQKALR